MSDIVAEGGVLSEFSDSSPQGRTETPPLHHEVAAKEAKETPAENESSSFRAYLVSYPLLLDFFLCC